MMSHSRGYNVFTGLVEATAGLLLFWRRTTPAGALLAAAALGNVVALNLAYDVTVKLHSLGLLAMALVLLAPDAARLWTAAVAGRAVGPARSAAPALEPGAPRWQRRTRLALKALLVAAGAGGTAYLSWSNARSITGPTPPLWGLYDVEAFTLDGTERAPLTTDPLRWKRLALDRGGRATLQVMSDSVRRVAYVVDTAKRTLTVEGRRRSTEPAYTPPTVASFRYADAAAPARLTLDGTVGGRPARLVLRRVDHTRFTLVSRGSHWVQDDNYQR